MRLFIARSRRAAATLWLGCAALFAPELLWGQRVVLDEDFESDVPDAFPASADFFAKSSILRLDADFNSNARVDGRDFLILQRGHLTGTTKATGDANGSGNVDADDFAIWQRDYGKNDPAGVAVTGGSLADPFDPGNNQSLAIRNPNGTSQMAVTWANEFADDPSTFRNGSIEFDLWMESPDPDAFWTFFEMRAGHGDAGRTGVSGTQADTTVWNTFRMQNNPTMGAMGILEQISDPGHRISFGVEATYNDDNSEPTAGAMAPDNLMHIRFEIDANSYTFADVPTYRLFVNDSQIVWTGTAFGAPDEPPWVLAPGPSLAPGINILSFFTDASAFSANPNPGTGNVYIDNLLVINNDLPPLATSVPEPATALLFASLFGAWQVRFRRTRTFKLASGC